MSAFSLGLENARLMLSAALRALGALAFSSSGVLAVGLLSVLLAGCGQGTNAPAERTGTQHVALSTDGLVAAFGFDEGQGQEVHDATGAAHGATLSGQSWIQGKFGSALEFDNAFLDVTTTPALDLTNAMTLTAWVLPKPGEPAEAMVLAKEYEWDAAYQLSSETWWGAGPRFDLYGSEWSSVDAGGHRLPTLKWSHLAATYDGASMKLYVDGALAAEHEYAGGAQVIDSPLRIGGMTWERFFHGRIDEIRIYNRALSASEIAEVMAEPVTAGAVADTTAPAVAMTAPAAGAVSGQVGLAADASDAGGVGSVQFLVDGQPYGYPVLAPPYQLNWHSRSATAGSHELSARATDFSGNVTISAPVVVTVDAANTTPGLVAAFGFDEGSGEAVHDATGAGHDTVRSGQNWVTGRFGTALEFDGSFLEVPGSSLLDLTNAMTVSAWVLPKTVLEDGLVLAKEQWFDSSFELYAGSWHGGPEWNLAGSNWGYTSTGNLLPTTRWSHIAGSYDGATIRLYVDGALVDETAFDEGARITKTPLHIGGMTWERFFRGRIDEIRIYNRVLSQSEIAAVMTQPVTAGATADATGPTVAMTAPVAGDVSGQVGLAADASDAGGVATVQFLVDGQPYGYPVEAPPYQLNWHSRAATPGSHEFSARATDFAGNATVSVPVMVTVDAANTTPGLVAAFGFDEGSGNDVHDSTGAGHDTVLTGQNWVVGKYGSALEFENSFVEVARSSLLDLTSAMTVSAWVLPKTQFEDMIVLAKEKQWDSSFELYAATPHGGPVWGLVGSGWEDTEAPSPLPTTRWSHVAGTYDGVAIKLYVDGALVDETPFDEGAHVTSTPLRIGGMTWDRFFKGRIDEVRIYNRALSATEIADVMTQPITAGATADTMGPTVALTAPAAGPVSGSVAMVAEASDAGGVASVQFLVDGQPYGYAVTAPPYQSSWHSRSATAGEHALSARATDFAGNVSISAPVVVTVDAANTTPGLVAAFSFDEGSGEDVHDDSGAGHDTTRNGQTWVAGKFGSALAFDQSWLQVGRSPLLNLTTDMTLSAWVLPNPGEPSDAPIIAKEDLWQASYVLDASTYWSGPRLDLLGTSWNNVQSPKRLPTTAWSHVAATYSQNQAKIYVNGVLVADGPIEGPIQVTDTPLRIGGTWTWYSYFHGRIDEVRIYNRALSGSEVAQVMTQPVTVGATADVTPPSVAMTAPVAGAVSGQVGMAADASDASGIASVQFLVDGQPYGYPVHAPPYQLNWHSNAATAGSHELSARATDFAGNASVSAPVAVTVDAASTTPGLVAAYGFDEGSGEDVHEATGTGLDAVLSGQTWVAGKYGSALDFDADFLEIGRSHLFDLTTSMTLSAWVLPKPGEPSDFPIIAKEDFWQGSYLLNADSYYAGPRLNLLGAEWGDFATVESPTHLPKTEWTHVAATYEQNQAKIYVNGALVAEGPTDRDVPVSDTPLRIGGTFSWGSQFHGRIDEVRIYNRALSGSEIADVMTHPVTAGATADTTGPTVALTAPAAGPVSGQVGMVAEASDTSGIANVQFLVDGQPYGYAFRTPPYQLSWHSRAATPGSHELSARATDFAGNVSVSAPVVVTVDAANTTPGLVAAFAFDEGSGVDVHDSTGAGHDAVRTGQTWVGGRFGTALEFTDGYLDVEGSHLLDLTTAMTVSMWVLPEPGYLANTTLLAKEDQFQQSYFLNAGNWASRPELSLYGNSDLGRVEASSQLPSTKWTHLAGTYDGQHLRMYVNGELAQETEFEGGAKVTDTPLRLGGMTWGNNFSGRIDEVRIYNRPLSATEIVAVMSQPLTAGATADTAPPTVAVTSPAPGTVSGNVLVAAQATDDSGVRQVELMVDGVTLGGPMTSPPFEKHWFAASAAPGTHELRARATDRAGNVGLSAPVTVVVEDTGAVPGLVAAFGFDEGSGEAVHDATGAGHDTVLAGQTWATGKYGGALAFDGSYLTVADSDLLDLTTGMTLSAWVRPTAPLPDWPAVVLKETDNDLAYALYAGSDADGAPSTWYSSSITGSEVGGRGGERLELGLWTHLAATFDGAHLRMYVNGQPTVDVATTDSIVQSTNPLRIGGDAVWNNEWFYGLIDEVRIYNRALSEAEIGADMVRPVSEGAAPDTTPPQVAVTSPLAGSTVFGSVTLRAQASDAYGIESVQFLLDGVATGSALSSAPFETSWSTSGTTAGAHTLTALAFDRSGNSALSAPVVVTVSDTPPACDPATVTDGNPCTADSCSAQGQPVFTPLAAGTSCSDGDRCNGVEVCSGAGVCAPDTPPSTDATCNGVDDDCDGQTDEDYVGASTSCGVGACARTATIVCQNGSPTNTCTPGTPAASDATCNGIDDDCDGSVDEDYAPVATSCGVGSCAATGTSSCVNGAIVNSCVPGVPAASDASCNGVDNDCDGSVDEDYVPVATTCGASACSRTGVTSCSNGAVVDSCVAGSPAANDATCDGIDNDCDGSTDEDFVPTSTSCGVGACAATGTTSCVGGVIADSCRPGVAAATDASCNGVDDDCNGQRDEDFVPTATNCGLGACAAVGTTSCVNGAVRDSCAPSTPAAADNTCNGVDDDCDGSVDDDYVAPETQCGLGACAAMGHERCVAGQLQNDCQEGSGSTQDSSCNGVDDDCDGSVDEDYVATPTSCGAGACARTGNLRCQNGSVVNDCTAGTPAASDATCNGVDDDCDGRIDEDYVSTPTTCAQGACQATGQTRCVGGTVEDSCAPGTPGASDANCDGLDNDCDGAVDEGYVARGTTCGVGACARTGNTSCVAGREADSCQPGSAASSDTTCNGVDDDCDGSTDEDYVAAATTCGIGACAAAGQIRCQGGALVTDCTAGTPASDANCNGVDDDCDGSIDEDYVPVATSCGAGACAATGMSRCEAGNVVSGCTAGTPATLDASCDGIDNDCDGSTDEDYVPEPVSCGVGACVRSGQTRCQAGTVEPVCTPGTAAASDSSCNGIDDDCNGAVDEDYVARPTTCGSGSCTSSGTTACQAGQEVDSCRPSSGSASDTVCNGIDDDCDGSVDEDFVGQTTTCGVGVCAATGTSSCQNGAVVAGCTAKSPTGDDANCNGLDDDCDGSVDEAYVPVPVSCGVGACRATGVTSCTAGVEAPQCTPGTAAPSDATCNGIDDDCDNSIDEDFVQQPTSCGQGACAATGHTACENGQTKNTCAAGQAAASDAACNGVDDDCDGSIDEDYAATPTSCGAGACARTGNLRCQSGSVVNDCTAGTPAASDATCNGIDDDCNGTVDEDYVSTPTTCAVGACQATGQTRCVGGAVEDSCTPGSTSAADETCDGLDNDCDGAVDEGYVPRGTTCGVGACARTGTTSCVSGQESNSCQPGTAATGDATCDGVDDDCDGTADEDYVATATTCGVGACAAAGQIRCQGGALVTDCTAGTPASDANCNGVDDDCDGSVDEDYVPTPTSCGVGACAATGTSRCEAGQVVSGCTAGTPATLDASCDGIDNDCDGSADEDYVPEPVSCGVGACVRSGQTRCQAGTVEPVCTPGTAAANDASCNGIDDDCNGTVDEDYVARATSCGRGSCTSNGTTACQAGQEVDSCRPTTGAASDTVCNGIDDDCDGSIDEDFVPTQTTCGVGVCAATGTSACQNGAVVPGCTAGSPTGDDSNCNGVDDDCDGSVDEAYVPVPVSCGVGACRATGVTSCEAGVEAPQCTPGAAAPNDATCNGIDDDCDNSVDEDFVEVPTSCGRGACSATGHTACQNGQPQNTCEAGQPAASDTTCNGVDDDCDGSVDEDYAPRATSCGQGACAATGTSSCVNGAEQPNCTPRAASPNDSSCNNVDDDCDGSVDEDYAGTPTSCGRGACASTGTTTCSAGQVSDSCRAGTPATSDATCNGVDDDCDGSFDEDYVPQETVCGVGACRTTGAIACQNGQASDTCTPLPKAGNDDDCNGVDDDCDGQTDESFAARCAGTAIQTCSSGALQTQECQDTDVCNGTESCSAARCVAGNPISTDDGNPCTADSCSAGGVSHSPLALGSGCGQGKVCDGQGACIGKPVITTQPSSVSVSPGADAAFGVTATGALLTYQWRRLGQPIGGATSATLVLPNVQPADTGTEITVAVSNPAGTVVSAPVTLTVSDTTGPVLIIDGDAQRSVSANTLLLTGTALDNGQPAASLTASSSRFPGDVAGIIDAGTGAFKIEVPVSPGANTITLTAKDTAGNATQKSVVATLELSRLPTVTITAPANGFETDAEKVNVTGYVRSSLPPEQIRLVLGTTVLFPSGSGGEYSFAFNDVRLNFGPNLLSVRAETPDGTVTAMAAVLRREPGEVSADAPVVAVIGGSSLQFVKDSTLPIKGTVSSKRCTTSVTVNGNAATLVGAGSEISFNYSLALASGDQEVPVEVLATDCDGRLGRLNYTVIHDDVAPAIDVALAPSPAVHNVSTTPYLIVGKITESHLATVTSNQQSLGVLPGAAGSYDFSFAVPLTRGQDDVVTVEAIDQAGNRATYSITLHLDAAVDIEVIAPVSGSEIQTLKDPVDVDVVARIVGLPADFTANVRLDNGGIYPLSRSDSTFKTKLSVRGLTASHTAAISVLNGAGTAVATKSASFKVTDVNSIPVQASLKTPANGSSNVEANEPIVVELNRPVVDPQKIKIEVTETVHGKRYKPYALGSSIAEFTDVQLEDINSDQGSVPGGMSFLPGDRLYAFYPARDYGYGGVVTVRVTNDGAELLRSQFNVRPLPTLVTGFVADQFGNPISDLDVRLDDVQLTTQTNLEGVFSFGFGKAEDSIPAGRHKLLINAGLKNRRYAVREQWINLQAGRMGDLGVVPVPQLDAGEPFRHLAGGRSSVLLRGGDLELDLSSASLMFPDGTTEGDVHTDVYFGPMVGYPAVTIGIPALSYALQPMGVEVSGPFSVNFALPPAEDGSSAYIDALPEFVMLVGLDKTALQLVPIGVGRVDRAQRRLRSARPLEVQRLDFIGMAPLRGASFQSLFSKFADGLVDLETLMMAVEKTR